MYVTLLWIYFCLSKQPYLLSFHEGSIYYFSILHSGQQVAISTRYWWPYWCIIHYSGSPHDINISLSRDIKWLNGSIQSLPFFRIFKFMKMFNSKLVFLTFWLRRHRPAPLPEGTFCHQRITYWRAWCLSPVTRYTMTLLNGLFATLKPELCCLKIIF